MSLYAFNELCIRDEYVNKIGINESKKNFDKFIRLIILLKNEYNVLGIVSSENVWNVRLAKDYCVRDWINDNTVGKEIRTYAKSLISKITVIHETDGEVYLDCDNSIMCKAATFIKENKDVLAMCSVSTDEKWDKSLVSGTYIGLKDDGDLYEEKSDFLNYSGELDIKEIKIYERENEIKKLASTYDIWEKKETLFPNLIFCDSVREQLEEYPEQINANAILKKLLEIQKYFEIEHKYYDPKEMGSGARTESESVKKDYKYKSERLFKLPSGEKRYFFDHVGFNGTICGRIYFYPKVENRKCYIGYIGPHLDTQKFKKS